MKIILGSKNPSKINAIKLAMQTLGYQDIEILSIDVPSEVSSKPINEETLIGAQNRNKNLYEYCWERNIAFDLLISIEGGYEKVNNTYFIVTYASVIDINNNEFIGKSQGLQISKNMFEWVSKGNSLNKVIETIIENKENKKENGITGYLTNGFYKREIFDSSAITSALQAFLNYNQSYQRLERKLDK